MPKLIPIDELNAELDAICLQIAAGKCIAVPTETVYGLAADASNGLAVARIFEMKGRPKFNPLICHVSDVEMARQIGEFDPLAEQLASAFWPGPLTLVLPLRQEYGIHPLVSANLGTVGLRYPVGPATKIIAACGKPLAAPSANRSGKISPTTAQHVVREFPESDLTVIDNGACSMGIESTIVKLESGSIRILRPGSVTAEMIEAATGIVPEVAGSNSDIEAPGMMASHYAPNAVLRLNQSTCPKASGLIAFGPGKDRDRCEAVETINLSETGDLAEAASRLYGALSALDEAGIETISVEPIPLTGLGVAINDRLCRAAAPKDDIT